jgi:hypothetical protein
MKKQSPISFAALGKQHLADLTTEVKETIAFNLAEPGRKVFTARIYGISIAMRDQGYKENIYKRTSKFLTPKN